MAGPEKPNQAQARDNLSADLFDLDDWYWECSTVAYTGYGPASTTGEEKREIPFLTVQFI